MSDNWEMDNGLPVAVEATGLYIDGEFLEDDPPADPPPPMGELDSTPAPETEEETPNE